MRWLYTFAVVSPTVARSLEELMLQETRQNDIHLEQRLLETLLSNQDHVAYYRSVLDAWNGLNHLLDPQAHALVEVNDPSLAAILHRARTECTCILVPSSTFESVGEESIKWTRKAVKAAGFYATRDFVHAVRDWTLFSKVTSCQAFFTYRILGVSLGDGGFKFL